MVVVTNLVVVLVALHRSPYQYRLICNSVQRQMYKFVYECTFIAT